MTDNRDTASRHCDYGKCDAEAVAIYEGIDPPDHAIQFASCEEHEPDGVEPVAYPGGPQ